MADVSAPLQVQDPRIQDKAQDYKAQDHKAQDRATASPARSWSRAGRFFDHLNRTLTYAKGLPVLTLIGSLLVGYFQYLSAYQEKVSAQAKEDMTAATTTFTEIANAFSEAQTLQQLLYFNYVTALDDKADGDPQALQTKSAQAVFPAYDHARTALRQGSDLMARKAEIYIDWASDFARDPAEAKTPSTDPLNESLLGTYNFDCDDAANIPHFTIVGASQPRPNRAGPRCAVDGDQGNRDPANTYVDLCARDDGRVIADKPAVTIHWYSTKHQVMTMHYCFERLHSKLLAARDWASQSSLGPELKAKFVAERAATHTALDNQAIRLSAFMSLAMFQMENIRVKYRPLGFACHIWFVTPVMNLFSSYCTPVRTTPARRAEEISVVKARGS